MKPLELGTWHSACFFERMVNSVNQTSEDLFDRFKRYSSGILGLLRLEGKHVLQSAGAKVAGIAGIFAFGILALAWLSASLCAFLMRWLPLELATLSVGGVFIACAVGFYFLERSRSIAASEDVKDLIGKFKGESFGTSDMPVHADAPKDELLQNVALAHHEIVHMSKDLKDTAIEVLNPVNAVRNIVTKNTGTVVLGSLALGLLFGIRNASQSEA